MANFQSWSDFMNIISYWNLPKDIMDDILTIGDLNYKTEDKIAKALRIIQMHLFLDNNLTMLPFNTYLRNRVTETREMIKYYELNPNG